MFVSCCRCVCFRLPRSGLFFVCQTGVFVFCPIQTAVVKLSGRLSWFIWSVYNQVAGLPLLLFPKIIVRQRIVIMTTRPSIYKLRTRSNIKFCKQALQYANKAHRTAGTASSRGERYRCFDQWCITYAGRQTLVAYAKGGRLQWIKKDVVHLRAKDVQR